MTDAEELREAIRWAATRGPSDYVSTSHLAQLVTAAGQRLEQMPKTHRVEKWVVTYWSLTHRKTVAVVVDDQLVAQKVIDANGSTAVAHKLQVHEWDSPPGSGL